MTLVGGSAEIVLTAYFLLANLLTNPSSPKFFVDTGVLGN
jgi:hypothetical protein